MLLTAELSRHVWVITEIVKKGLSKLWKQEPVTFANFATVSSEELINLVEKMPAKFAKKSRAP